VARADIRRVNHQELVWVDSSKAPHAGFYSDRV